MEDYINYDFVCNLYNKGLEPSQVEAAVRGLDVALEMGIIVTRAEVEQMIEAKIEGSKFRGF